MLIIMIVDNNTNTPNVIILMTLDMTAHNFHADKVGAIRRQLHSNCMFYGKCNLTPRYYLQLLVTKYGHYLMPPLRGHLKVTGNRPRTPSSTPPIRPYVFTPSRGRKLEMRKALKVRQTLI